MFDDDDIFPTDDDNPDDEILGGYFFFSPEDTIYPGFTGYIDEEGTFFIYGSPLRPVAAGSIELETLTRLEVNEAPDEVSMLGLGHEPIRCEDLITCAAVPELAKQIQSFCEYK